MQTIYQLQIPASELKHSTDMLRYDNAYAIEKHGEDIVIYCLSFTLRRWLSFRCAPSTLSQSEVTDKEAVKLWARAMGFVAGLQAAYFLTGKRLVEGNN